MKEVDMQPALGAASDLPPAEIARGASSDSSESAGPAESTESGDLIVIPEEPPQRKRTRSWLRHSGVLAHETIETVITALTLAFIFRAFLIEAFIIPTGSMAQSLMGEHRTYVCPACGWQYDVGALSPRRDDPADLVAPDGPPTCPNCHLPATIPPPAVKAGDRILVHKWPFDLGGWFGPRRWDVIVFRDPADPRTNYIKRLVALPGDTIEVADGDIFIDGRVSRKTPAAQQSLWFLVHDQSHVSAPEFAAAQPSPWRVDRVLVGAAGWTGLDTRVVRYEGLDAAARALEFETGGVGPYHQDFYAYNGGSSGAYVGDIRVSADVRLGPAQGVGGLRIELDRHGKRFTAVLGNDGSARLTMAPLADGGALGAETVIRELAVARPERGVNASFEFGYLDWRAYLRIGNQVLATDDEQYADDLDAARTAVDWPARLRIVAQQTTAELRGLRVDRDVYYTGSDARSRRAHAGHPFTLNEGEYFVMGDNSPHSHDSREWSTVGPHLRQDYFDDRYRMGTVREDQIVGRAFFVYLPGLLPADEKGWRMVDVGRIRFIR